MHVSTHRHSIVRTRVLAVSALAAALGMLGASTATGASQASATHPSGPSHSATERSAAPAAKHHHKAVYKVKFNRLLFGVHDRYLTSLNHRTTGSIRLWDAGTTWPEIEPVEGPPDTWNWAPLDAVVEKAHQNHTQVTLVLGISPSYAAASPTDAPDVSLYKAYLTAVMQRYKDFHGYRGIAAYQVWNEANITTFWTGTTAELDGLVQAAYQVRNAVDPKAMIIAPAMVTRLGFEQTGIKTFYASKIGGKPIWKYVDAISLNLYPPQTVATAKGTRFSTPEDTMVLLNTVRGLLAKDKVPSSLQIWNTEVNYGIGSGTAATPIPSSQQVANVMRTYLLNAAEGVKRVDWYAWDMGELPTGGTLGNTLLTNPADGRDGGVLTPAGRAFARIQTWMKGTMIGTATKRPCITDSHGTYTCTIKYAHGYGRIYWNPYRTAKVKLVASARTRTNELGVTRKAKGGSKLKVNFEPVLVKSKK